MDDFFHDPEPQALDPLEDQTYRFSDAGGQIVRNEALTRQLRNLLLLSPLFQLEHSKARLGPEGESLMDGLDTLYLSLSLLDFVSERMVMDLGAQRTEILTHLCGEIVRLEAALPDATPRDESGRTRAAELILDALTNARDQHCAFEPHYYDASHGRYAVRRFRLLGLTDEPDGVLRYLLTSEGLTAYLAMLDVEPALAQQAEEILIGRLLERGRFRDALRLARRARTRTLEFRKTLRKHLLRAQRSSGAVSWSTETLPHIAQAIDHIEERQREEHAMLRGLAQHDLEDLPFELRQDLVDLRDTIADCLHQHAQLHREAMSANDRFLLIQSTAFRAPRVAALPDLESQVLEPLLARPLQDIARVADTISSRLNPPKVTGLLDPMLLISMLKQSVTEAGETDTDEETGELRTIDSIADRFDPALQERMLDWARQVLSGADSTTFSSLLKRASDEGLDTDERLCLAYLVIAAFHPRDDRLGVRVRVFGRFQDPLLEGDDLTLEPH